MQDHILYMKLLIPSIQKSKRAQRVQNLPPNSMVVSKQYSEDSSQLKSPSKSRLRFLEFLHHFRHLFNSFIQTISRNSTHLLNVPWVFQRCQPKTLYKNTGSLSVRQVLFICKNLREEEESFDHLVKEKQDFKSHR